MISAYFVPLWQILMWAPQYPEGLEMKIWINTLSGDVKIISALNHYIGMKHIEAEMFPEFKYMIYIVGFLIGFGVITAIAGKTRLLWIYAALILTSGIAALWDFYLWGYDYGHNLDPKAPIVVPGMAYQPPLIGTKQLLNFTAFSGPDIGGWIFLAVGVVAFATIAYERVSLKAKTMKTLIASLVIFTMMTSCSTAPEPLVFGKDPCYTCKMTLMDSKYGAEVVTKKGKVYKFDDVSCLINFYKSDYEPKDNIAHVLVIDFGNPEHLIDATSAYYAQAEQIRSPMASNVAAFHTTENLKKYNSGWQGKELTWNELKEKLR